MTRDAARHKAAREWSFMMEDGNLKSDLTRILSRRAALSGGLAALAGGAGLWLALRSQASAQTATAADGTICVMPPAETGRPLSRRRHQCARRPDGECPDRGGVERSDLTDSFAGFTGRAEGIPLDLEMTLVNVGGACAPLQGLAVYLWHCDAAGRYSLYSVPEANWLRGLQVTDGAGRLTFRTILPGVMTGAGPTCISRSSPRARRP